MKIAIKISLLTLLISCVINVQTSLACSCDGSKTLIEAYKISNSVTLGTIIAEEFVTLRDPTNFPDLITIVRYKFLIEKVYKGSFTKDTVLIYTGSGGGDCGYPFLKGGRYIVYGMDKAYLPAMGKNKYPKGKNITWTFICLPTSKYSNEAVNELDKIRKKD